MLRLFMIVCLILAVTFAPITPNAWADDEALVAAAVIAAPLALAWLFEWGPFEPVDETYLPDQDQDTQALEEHLDRLNAVSFTGPESQGRARQQGHAGTNAGVTYTLFEW